jgi:hypothetical protein
VQAKALHHFAAREAGLTGVCRLGILLTMSTLLEIESAVTSLPPAQQRTLLAWLQSVVEAKTQPVPQRQNRREAWLQRLAVRRQRGITGKTGTSLQQIMDDLRGD